MDGIQDILWYLVANLSEGEASYLKSKAITPKVEYSKRQVSTRLLAIGDDDDLPVVVETWSKSNGSMTFRIIVEDARQLRGKIRERSEERVGGGDEHVPEVV